MYKLMIIDDEERVRNGFIEGIEWNDYEIEVVAEAENGVEAIEKIKKTKPDIIITDIYMPKMDGLELIDYIYQIVPHSKVIIISGYNNFQYAQKAIRNKAFDYILKPIDLDKMMSVIKKAKKQIEKELFRIKNEELLKKQLKYSIPFLKEKYLNYLITNQLTFQEIEEQYKFIDFNLSSENFLVMVIAMDNNRELKSNYKKTTITERMGIKKAIEFIINKDMSGEVLESNQDRFITIINYNNKDNILENISKTALRIQNQIDNLYDKDVTIGIGRWYKESDYISNSYSEALEALDYRIFLGKKQVIYIDDVTINKERTFFPHLLVCENKLISALKIGDRENTKKQLSEFVDYCFQNNINPKEIKRLILQLIYTIIKKTIEWDLTLDLQKKSHEKNIYNLNILEEMKDYLMNFINKILKIINNKKGEQNCQYVKKASVYIRKYYFKDLSIQDIANYVYITPQYLSNIFKESTGKTLIEYLTETRIKAAKKMLRNSNRKIYQIAEEIGYNDSRYFSKVFKKHVNSSPKEYRSNS